MATEPDSVAEDQVQVYTEEITLDLPQPNIPVIKRLFCEPFNLCITIAGYSFCSTVGSDRPDTVCNQIESLLAPLMSLLGMLNPFFLAIDVIIAIQQCILAIPEALLSLSPTPLLQCVENLIAAIIALLCAIYPPFVIPQIISSVVNFLLHFVECIEQNLAALCDAIDRINNLDNLLLGDPTFSGAGALLGSARLNIGCRVKSTLGGLLSICSLIEVLNGFGEIANTIAGQELVPPIYCPDFGVDTPCDEALAVVRTLRETLENFSALILDCPGGLSGVI